MLGGSRAKIARGKNKNMSEADGRSVEWRGACGRRLATPTLVVRNTLEFFQKRSPLKLSSNISKDNPFWNTLLVCGVPIKIDRGCTSSLPKFNKVEKNAIYCHHSKSYTY